MTLCDHSYGFFSIVLTMTV
uniref:Uncharacterized protein n=1 Tax=Anguilla anguilla TaxID=7936 RepID=A0A0E9U7R4_ANGAN